MSFFFVSLSTIRIQTNEIRYIHSSIQMKIVSKFSIGTHTVYTTRSVVAPVESTLLAVDRLMVCVCVCAYVYTQAVPILVSRINTPIHHTLTNTCMAFILFCILSFGCHRYFMFGLEIINKQIKSPQ